MSNIYVLKVLSIYVLKKTDHKLKVSNTLWTHLHLFGF